MKAAVLYEYGQPLAIEEVDLEDPKEGEVLVKIGAAGICRSDRHFMHGDAQIALPAVLGHEGAGTVEKVGPGVTLTRPGDQVILSFVPACGRCKSCLEGHSNLCDLHMSTGPFMLDRTTRLSKNGQAIHHMGKVACFAEYAVVPETGCVPLSTPLPMDKAAMIGCCVPTGVGAAMFSANV
ncbi:MAG: alcohol dehydrogenase catalytic domain-containing protein [Dehalococcoidia bacterium]